MALVDLITVVIVSVLTVFLAEGLSFVLTSRDSVERSQSKLARVQSKLDKKSQDTKKEKKLEREKQEASSSANSGRTTSMIIVSVTMFVVIGILSAIFDGVVIAKLPFQPIGFLKSITHRGVLGDDYTEAGMMCIYILCSMAIRPSVQKLLGTTAPPLTMK